MVYISSSCPQYNTSLVSVLLFFLFSHKLLSFTCLKGKDLYHIPSIMEIFKYHQIKLGQRTWVGGISITDTNLRGVTSETHLHHKTPIRRKEREESINKGEDILTIHVPLLGKLHILGRDQVRSHHSNELVHPTSVPILIYTRKRGPGGPKSKFD